MSEPSPARPKPASTAPRPLRSAWISGCALALCVALSFTGYAFLAPATYRASATVVLTAEGADRHALGPLEASRRLSEAILDKDLLEQLTREIAPGQDGGARLRAGRALRDALEVESVDGLRFTISSRAPSSERARVLTQRFAEKAAAVAPRVLAADRRAERQRLEAERRRKSDELVGFLTQHPELKSEPTTVGASEATASATRAQALRVLLAERANVEARLATRGMTPPSDNPYAEADTNDAEADQLERRLSQLNTAIFAERNAARSRAAPPSAPAKAGTAQNWAEFQRLLREVEEARNASEALRNARPAVHASVSAPAVLPTQPIEPNRKALLGWCAWLAPLSGALLGAFVFVRSNRRLRTLLWSSAPPPSDLRSEPPPPPDLPKNLDLPNLGPPNANAASFIELSSAAGGASTQSNPFAKPPTASAPSPWFDQDAKLASALPNTAPGAKGRASQPPPQTVPTRERRSSRPPAAGYSSQPPVAAPLGANAGAPGGAGVMRTTQKLGSPIPPILVPGRGSNSSIPPGPASEGGYRFVSSPPPVSPNAVRITRDSTPILALPVNPTWQPDAHLNPDSRKALCDEIYPLAVDHCFVVGVSGTSVTRAEKSRLAAELALALSESEHPRVLLLEGDLMSPAIHTLMQVEMPKGRGLTEQLEERVAHSSVRAWVVMECLRSLHLLGEGPRPKTTLMLSHYFERCVQELRSYYDFILINGPILSEIAYCRALHDVVDEVLLVHATPNAADVAEGFELFNGKRLGLVQAPIDATAEPASQAQPR
ncbi:MAG TPA: hypothetical protein VFQ61_36895 [Polyangiaceae bacterium]|nr:hypothetical protein [Polyangiaceae bacterium]